MLIITETAILSSMLSKANSEKSLNDIINETKNSTTSSNQFSATLILSSLNFFLNIRSLSLHPIFIFDVSN